MDPDPTPATLDDLSSSTFATISVETAFSEEDLVQLSFLRDEEADALVAAGHLDEECRLSSPLESPMQFSYDELVLHVSPGTAYPVLLDTNGFFQVQNLKLPRVPCDALRTSLHDICDEGLQTNTLSVWNAREDLNAFGIFEPTMLILRLVNETLDHIQKHRSKSQKDTLTAEPNPGKKPSALMSASEMARDLLGRPEDIVARVPRYWRVLHVEEILRRNLANKFYAARRDLRENLERRPRQSLRKFQPAIRRTGDVVDHLVTPRLVFHGTKRATVPSIVRHGFLKPGDKLPVVRSKKGGEGETHGVRCGSTYGRGIYSSPSAEFALSYSGWYCEPTSPSEYFGLKLIACAVLMGRTAQITHGDEWWLRSEPFPGSDSHVGNDGNEYIVFDSARIIPVYVLHLDWGDANQDHLFIPPDPYDWSQEQHERALRRRRGDESSTGEFAGDRQRQKEAVMARARKWFPYGFGPQTGNNFHVEEVGYVSEDDEDYGEYQAMRATDSGAERRDNMGYWSWVKAAHNEDAGVMSSRPEDEYTDHRMRGAFGPHNWEDIPNPDQIQEPKVSLEDEGDWGLGGLMEELMEDEAGVEEDDTTGKEIYIRSNAV